MAEYSFLIYSNVFEFLSQVYLVCNSIILIVNEHVACLLLVVYLFYKLALNLRQLY